MSDPADLAQTFEEEHRAKSLATAPRPTGPPPEFLDGVACCADCLEPIPPARLAALPGVGLCVTCAQEYEGQRGNDREDDRSNDRDEDED